jgi:ABC-type glutathione transport system ATPase component
MKDVHIYPTVMLHQNAVSINDGVEDKIEAALQQKSKTKNQNGNYCNGLNANINGVELQPTTKYECTSLRSYSKWSPTDQGATLVWRDVCVYATKDDKGEKTIKRIINNVSGAVVPGKLVALMGSSGAGKSTLMSALAYRSARK